GAPAWAALEPAPAWAMRASRSTLALGTSMFARVTADRFLARIAGFFALAALLAAHPLARMSEELLRVALPSVPAGAATLLSALLKLSGFLDLGFAVSLGHS